jgi:hypothetical protein
MLLEVKDFHLLKKGGSLYFISRGRVLMGYFDT